MEEYNFTYASFFTDDYIHSYLIKLSFDYTIIGIKLKDHKYITIKTDRELTDSERSLLNDDIQKYSDYNQDVIDENILSKCKIWGRSLIDEFELRNMRRKDMGLMARVELDDIMKEAHDSFVFICLLEGSLDSLHGKLYGYPEQTIGDVVWPPRAAFSFEKVWQEDIDWIKQELNIFLDSL